MLSIVNEVDPLIFHCVCFVCDTNMCFSNTHYPQNCKETFRKKTLTKHLRVIDCKPTIIYTISLSFSLLLALQLQILERFLAQTLTLPNLSVKRSFSACGKHWNKPLISGCNLELIAGFG